MTYDLEVLHTVRYEKYGDNSLVGVEVLEEMWIKLYSTMDYSVVCNRMFPTWCARSLEVHKLPMRVIHEETGEIICPQSHKRVVEKEKMGELIFYPNPGPNLSGPEAS